MWSETFERLNTALLRFYNQESPNLPFYEDIEEITRIERNDGEKSIALSHLYHALYDLKNNYHKYFDQNYWNETPGYEWTESEFFHQGTIFFNLELLFKDVTKVGRPFTFIMYINEYCIDLQQDINLPLKKRLGPKFKNKFNDMPIEDVIEFFSVLTRKKNGKGEFWMSESEFETFIRRSFGNQTRLSKPEVNIGRTDKYAIVKLFWRFYDLCQTLEIAINRERDPFFELLKNAFNTDRFNDLRIDNFKNSKSKYDWD